MRLDRFITLNLVQPWRRLLGALNPQLSTLNSERVLPVLMYHGISDAPEPGVRPYYQLNTSPARFAEQMTWLKENGWRGVTLQEGLGWLRSEGSGDRSQGSGDNSQVSAFRSQVSDTSAFSLQPLALASSSSQKLVAITFDDGLQNFYTDAFPVLHHLGFSATVFLATAFVGDTRQLFRPAGSKPSTFCLTWSEVQGLHFADIEFGSHTVTHPKLVDLPWQEIARELRDSKAELEHRLQKSVTQFCYPYAFPQADHAFTRAFREQLAEVGYTACATTRLGRVWAGDCAFQLSRLPVNTADDRDLFEAKLHGAYDWLATPQALAKRIKATPGSGTSAASLRAVSPVVS
jgi:peptidoglycan/xylan/chitin deacetylase (PgdA/CDA1 family)